MGPSEPMGEPMMEEIPFAPEQEELEAPLELEEIMAAISAGCEACAQAKSASNSEAFERYAQGVWHLANALSTLPADPDPPEPASQPGGKPQSASEGQE